MAPKSREIRSGADKSLYLAPVMTQLSSVQHSAKLSLVQGLRHTEHSIKEQTRHITLYFNLLPPGSL